MEIRIEEDKKLITIHTQRTTYQMAVGKLGHLLHLYYGRRTEEDMRYLLTFYDRGFSGNPYDAGKDRTYSLDALPQEYPGFGTGDYRNAALQVENAQGICCCDLRYVGAIVKEGKYGLPGLPAVHTPEGGNETASVKDARTLEVTLQDAVNGTRVTLYYGVLADSDIITRAARIENAGGEPLTIRKAASCCVDFLNGDFDLLHFYGKHAMERMAERMPVMHGTQAFGSRRGTSSHQQNPFFVLAQKDATEGSGDCYGFSLLYSGNFKAEAERDQYEQTRVVMGLSDELFSWELKPGEVFYTPETAICFSGEGVEELSAQYHQLIRYHVCRGPWQTKPRPVLLNNWEATYFQFTGEKIVEIARQAAELGVEMLVLDDGWFGKRDSDLSGLGDWSVNEGKLGGSLKSVVDRVTALGMKFGLWIEPEMVSEDSELYRRHPDWAFAIPGREPVRARYQLVLDFSRREVVDAVLEQICAVLESADISYVKMDMNRHLSDIYSAGVCRQNQGAVLHKYMLGVYDFMERLLARFPELLLEGCSGGGGRFDAGMLYYAPQIWCSDNTDAIERIRIQYGTSFGYPVSTVGSHVSAVPNHQTGRITDIHTRGIVAMAGSFGYELDLKLLTETEKEIVRKQITDYKRFWSLIQNGRYSRLTDPFSNGEYAAWQFTAEDRSEALLNVVTLAACANPATEYVKLKGLEETAVYRMEGTDRCFLGSALMYAGIPIPRMNGEYQAWQVHFIRRCPHE